jgi:hypothetical protein
MKIALLGNGPSLRLNLEEYKDYNVIIFSNRLLWENFESLGETTKLVYICGDERFGKSVEWCKELDKSKFTFILSDKLYSMVRDQLNLRPIHSFSFLDFSTLVINFLQEFPPPEDLLSNVILDLGVPVALNLGGQSIELFGCDFDYKISEMNTTPVYFGGYKVRGASFDHTENSASAWSEFSQIRYKSMVKYLAEYEIVLRNGY